MGIQVLEQLLGEKVFIKGPHTNGIKLDAPKDFGHYNPEFLKKAESFLKKAMKDKELNSKIQNYYDNYLKNTARLYYIAYDQPTAEMIEAYKEVIANTDVECQGFLCPPSEYIQETFRPFAETQEKEGYNVYVGFTAPGFWLRRKMDGTSAQFYSLLKTFLKQYDAEFLK